MKPRLAIFALLIVLIALVAFASRQPRTWDAGLTAQRAMTGTGERTLAVGSARVVRSTQETDSTGKQISDLVWEGVADFDRKLVRYDRFTPQRSNGPRAIVLAGEVSYWRLPDAMVPLWEGKAWTRQNETELGRRLGFSDLPIILADPVRSLGKLRDVAGATRLGREKVRGVDTRRYRGTIAVPEVNSAITVEVWIDREGRVRRMRDRYNFTKLKFDLAELGRLGQEVTGSTLPNQATGDVWSVATTEYYDLGIPVAIQRPPGNDVSDFGLGRP